MSVDSSTLRSQITKSALHSLQVLANIGPKSKRDAEQTGNQDPQDEQWLSMGDVSGNSVHKSDHGPEEGQSSSIKDIKDIKPGYLEHKGDHGPAEGQSSSIRDLSPETQRKTVNVVLFGETGVGKSAVINLIARKDIAKVSSDIYGCTMQHQCYHISFDNMDFALFDTIGLEQPEMAVNGHLQAMEKAHELISKLSAAGGIHLLLFCTRGGRMTTTTRSNYKLFSEHLCNTQAPIALVFTGLETEVEMEDWWRRNKTHIEQYGIKSDGHACITAIQNGAPEGQRKYEQSQETIRELLKSCTRKGKAFSLESDPWLAGFSRKMEEFVPGKESPEKEITKVLTNRCQLDVDTAGRIAAMLDKSEEGGVERDGPTKNPTTNGTSLGEQDTKAASVNGGKEVTQDGGPPQELGNVEAVPGALPQGPRDVKASLGVVPVKEIGRKNVADTGALHGRSSVKAPLVIPNRRKDITKDVDGPVQEPRSVKAPPIGPGQEAAKKYVADGILAQSTTLRDSSPETPPQTVNVVLFDETGVGKSSVINLIAGKDIAKVSSDINGCTMQSHFYSISFDNMDFTIYDTIGLEEPQMGVNGYLKAIEKAHELISRLSAAGGIHLLLFCMRSGRITATTQSNYRLFCECLCNTKVPIALVFTGLEREVEMEDWWKRNKTHIEHYGIKSNGHARITAVQDDDPVEQRKYEKSKETIRELLKSCATRDEAFSLESHYWFAGFLRKMKDFVPEKKRPKEKDIMKMLTNRCKLDADTAKRIAEMIKSVPAMKSPKDNMNVLINRCNLDTDTARMIAEMMDKIDKGEKNPTTNDTSLGEQEDTKAASGVSVNGVKVVAQVGGLPQELGNVKAAPDVVEGALPLPRGVKASIGVVPVKEIEKKCGADTSAQLQEPSNVKALLSVAPPGKEVANKNVVDAGTRQNPSIIKTPSLSQEKMSRKNSGIKVVPGDVEGALPLPRGVKASIGVVPVKEIERKCVADTGARLQEPSNVKAPVAGKEVAKKNAVDAGFRQDPSSIRTPPLSQEKMSRKNSGIKAVPGDVANKNMASGVRAFLP